jgi:hypothetical protein
MATYRNGRKLISVTCKPELYDTIQLICKEKDLPVSVWARQVLEKEVKEAPLHDSIV